MDNEHYARGYVGVSKTESIVADVPPMTSAYDAQQMVDAHNRAASHIPTSGMWLAFDAVARKSFKLAGYGLLGAIVLGLLIFGAMLAIHENRLSAERDPEHGGIGRSLIASKLSDYRLPPGEPGFGLAQMAGAVRGGLPAISNGSVLKLRKQELLQYAPVAYRCVLSERCWAEAQTSPARGGIAVLAELGARLTAATAEPGPTQAALVGLRLYRGNQPARHALGHLQYLHQQYPDNANLAAMNAAIQSSWLLHMTAWAEQLEQP